MESLTDVHVVLPTAAVDELDRLAQVRGTSRGHLIEDAVATYLAMAEARQHASEMRTYAEDLGEYSAEFAATMDHLDVARLLRDTEW